MEVGAAAPEPPPLASPRVLHIISSLTTGGAERMLVRLLGSRGAQGFQHRVLSLTAGGALIPDLRSTGAEVESLAMRRGLPRLRDVLRLRRAAAGYRPDLLVGWMYHGNLAASHAAGAVAPRPPVVWNIRHTPDDLGREKRFTAAMIRWGSRWAKGAAAVVYNAAASAQLHYQLGYPRGRARVIPNGFDCQRFRPSEEARQELRQELGVAPETSLIGRIGRFHPMKGFETFLAAAGRVAARERGGETHWVLAGRQVELENSSLRAALEAAALGGRVHLLGQRRDMPTLLAALDGCCSSSHFGEGFPNIVAEAMACGVPCVVTDVGDSAAVVGDTGIVVPPADEAALAAALTELLGLTSAQRRDLGRGARRRIEEKFSAAEVFPRHGELWRACLAGGSVDGLADGEGGDGEETFP